MTLRFVFSILFVGLTCACESQKQFALIPQPEVIESSLASQIPQNPEATREPDDTDDVVEAIEPIVIGEIETPVLPVPLATPLPVKIEEPVKNSVVETYVQKSVKNKVDILIVSDNSTSMYEDQKKLGKRFHSFTSSLSEVDWQIGVTTTDVTHGKFGLQGDLLKFSGSQQHILQASTPNAETLFKNTVVRQETLTCEKENSSCPSTVEEPLKATILAIEKRNSTNRGFFRDNSEFVVLIISDEDEKERRPQGATQPAEVVKEFQRAFGVDKNMKAYGIVIKPGDEACFKEQHSQFGWAFGTSGGATYGTAVADFAQLTGGTVGSICEKDYSFMLKDISQRIRKSVSTFLLSQDPVSNSIRVNFEPAENRVPYEVEGRQVIFSASPLQGTKVEVTYVPQ